MNMSHHSEYLTVRMSENHRQWFIFADYLFFLVRGASIAVVHGKSDKMMINAFGDNRNFRVQLYLFTPVSLFFTGSIFSPEYAFLIVCPFILRKALNITR